PVDDIISRPFFLGTDQHDGVWIANGTGEFARLRHGTADVVVRPAPADGPVISHSLSVDGDGSAWLATSRGLYHWQLGHVARLDRRNGLPCTVLYSAIRDDHGALWLNARCGLLRIPAPSWAGWLQDSERKVSMDVLDFRDGAQPSIGSDFDQPIVSKSPDG